MAVPESSFPAYCHHCRNCFLIHSVAPVLLENLPWRIIILRLICNNTLPLWFNWVLRQGRGEQLALLGTHTHPRSPQECASERVEEPWRKITRKTRGVGPQVHYWLLTCSCNMCVRPMNKEYCSGGGQRTTGGSKWSQLLIIHAQRWVTSAFRVQAN